CWRTCRTWRLKFPSLPPLSPREAVEREGQGPKGGRQEVGHFSAGQGWPVRKTPQRGTHSTDAARRAPDGGALLFGSVSLGHAREMNERPSGRDTPPHGGKECPTSLGPPRAKPHHNPPMNQLSLHHLRCRRPPCDETGSRSKTGTAPATVGGTQARLAGTGMMATGAMHREGCRFRTSRRPSASPETGLEEKACIRVACLGWLRGGRCRAR